MSFTHILALPKLLSRRHKTLKHYINISASELCCMDIETRYYAGKIFTMLLHDLRLCAMCGNLYSRAMKHLLYRYSSRCYHYATSSLSEHPLQSPCRCCVSGERCKPLSEMGSGAKNGGRVNRLHHQCT